MRYGEAVLIGFVLGTLSFLVVGLWNSGGIDSQVRSFLVLATAGVLIACGFLFCWKWSWRRAHQRHNRDRRMSLVREHADH